MYAASETQWLGVNTIVKISTALRVTNSRGVNSQRAGW
jgi:hypothetical protein